MSNQHTIKIPRQTDRSVVENLAEHAKNYSVPNIALNIGAAGTITYTVNEESEKKPEAVAKLLDHNQGIIETATVNIPGFGVTYYRGGYPNQNQEKSPYFDELRFNFNQQQCKLSESERVDLLASLTNAFDAFDLKRTISSPGNEHAEQLLSIHNATLEKLESTNLELVRSSQEFRRNIETDYQERADKLETKFQERSEALEKEQSSQREKLRTQEEKLAERIKAIDDRQNTHVRREIRKDILDEIRTRSESFSLTKSTNKLRWPVHAVSILLLLLLGASSIFYANELIKVITADSPAPTASLVVLGIKQILLSAAFGSVAVFYLRWLNSWFKEHASTEFKLRQFQLDIERASWVVETALEWKDAKGGTIPDALLKPISKNLFEHAEQEQSEINPADELASALLGSAAKVNLKAGDSSVEIDGSKLAKAK